MINKLPLELLLHILSSSNVSDLIKFRAVNKKWRLVIDQHLLPELNVFNHVNHVRFIFLKYARTHSNPKNSIQYNYSNPKHKSIVNLEKIQFLFRNARKLSLSTSIAYKDPMTEFISE